MNGTGTVTISLDLELVWGMMDDLEAAYDFVSENRTEETAYLGRLLDCCDRFDIPLTFATVGHLFLDACDGTHADLFPTDGIRADPGTDRETDPELYAPDLIRSIREAKTDHEIATHTFSHVVCDSVPAHVVEGELKAVADIYDANGLEPPRSLVAPRNRLPDPGVLRQTGIDIVRASSPVPAKTELGKYATRLRGWGSRSLPVFEPTVADGLVRTYSTPYPSLTAVHLPNGQARPLAPFQAIPRSARQRYHEAYLHRALETASETGADLHLWSHLFNLSNGTQWPPIRSFLRALAEYRDRDAIRIETMAERARTVRSEQRTNEGSDSRYSASTT